MSRPTTRRAIQELVDKGLLVRKRGVGTQVVQTPVHRPVELTSLYEISRGLARSRQPGCWTTPRVRRPGGRRRLNLEVGAAVVTMRRLRTSGGQPLALMTNHLPAAIAPDRDELERAGLCCQSLRSHGVHIRLARQRIGAKAAERDEAKLLDEKPKAPLLVMEGTAFDDTGRIIEYGSHAYRASRYYFDTTLVDR